VLRGFALTRSRRRELELQKKKSCRSTTAVRLVRPRPTSTFGIVRAVAVVAVGTMAVRRGDDSAAPDVGVRISSATRKVRAHAIFEPPPPPPSRLFFFFRSHGVTAVVSVWGI
jgi:hypothetical protein